MLEYWNAWTITEPKKQFEDSQEAAMALLVRTVEEGTHAYDFFMVHLLTTSHAVRVLLPLIPGKFHVGLVRQWWLLTIAVYIAQLRPRISEELEGKPKPSKGWGYVDEMAVKGPWCTDAHYVKGKICSSPGIYVIFIDMTIALRAMKAAAFTWGDVHERYLAAAVNFADDFKGWTGFGGSANEREVN